MNREKAKKLADVYEKWLCENHWKERCDMSLFRRSFIKYTDELKSEIIRLCNADKLDELQKLIEENLK